MSGAIFAYNLLILYHTQVMTNSPHWLAELATTKDGHLPGSNKLLTVSSLDRSPSILLRSCMSFSPEQIPASSLTHVNFAFALISDTFEVTTMNPGDEELWSSTTNLKANAPALKVFLSIGGWSFNVRKLFYYLKYHSYSDTTFNRTHQLDLFFRISLHQQPTPKRL